jgi:hypothetical protein
MTRMVSDTPQHPCLVQVSGEGTLGVFLCQLVRVCPYRPVPVPVQVRGFPIPRVWGTTCVLVFSLVVSCVC